MKRNKKTVEKRTSTLVNAFPRFVSLVRRGANLTPFSELRFSDEANQSDVEINSIIFAKTNFSSKEDVVQYLQDNDFTDCVVVEHPDVFVVAGLETEKFEEVSPIEMDNGVQYFVGKLKHNEAAMPSGEVLSAEVLTHSDPTPAATPKRNPDVLEPDEPEESLEDKLKKTNVEGTTVTVSHSQEYAELLAKFDMLTAKFDSMLSQPVLPAATPIVAEPAPPAGSMLDQPIGDANNTPKDNIVPEGTEQGPALPSDIGGNSNESKGAPAINSENSDAKLGAPEGPGVPEPTPQTDMLGQDVGGDNADGTFSRERVNAILAERLAGMTPAIPGTMGAEDRADMPNPNKFEQTNEVLVDKDVIVIQNKQGNTDTKELVVTDETPTSNKSEKVLKFEQRKLKNLVGDRG